MGQCPGVDQAEPGPSAHLILGQRLDPGSNRAHLAAGQHRQCVALDDIAGPRWIRDGEGMPSGERVPPTPGPWDDAFTDVADPPLLEWGAALRVEVESTCSWWVVYTEPAHAVCVEPQSGPPDALNGAADVVVPGAPLVHEMRWRWMRG